MGNRLKNRVTPVDIAGHAAFGLSGRSGVPAYQIAKAASAAIQKGRIGPLNGTLRSSGDVSAFHSGIDQLPTSQLSALRF
jgi:hypothetical protein